MKEKKPYAKHKMACPWCQEKQDNGNFRPFSTNGMSMHVRMLHPEHYDQFQSNRDAYIKQFACDDDGVLIGSPAEPVSEPEIEEEVISESEYVEPEPPKPAPKKARKPKPIPEEPMEENFLDEQEPERSGYNPYGFTD